MQTEQRWLTAQVGQNVLWGIRIGLAMAFGFSLIVGFEVLILGPAAVTRIGVTLPAMILMYVSAGILGGAVLGLSRPLARTHAGALLLGVFVATVVYGMGVIAIYGLPSHWHGKQWFTVVALGVGMGLAGGEKFYSDWS